MKNIKKFFTWIINNKEWLFCGFGIAIFSLIIALYTGSKDGVTDTFKDTNNIEVHSDVNGDISQNSIIYNFSEDTEDDQLTEEDQIKEKDQSIENELVNDIYRDKIYPKSIDIKDEQKVGDWIYFRYMLEETYRDYTINYPALFRYKEDDYVAERVNELACYHFEVVGDCVYYLDSITGYQDHGELYLLSADDERLLLDDELYDFQIADEQYIYYLYRHDTIGVGLEGHAVHRMNLDGSEKMVVAYEVSGIDGGTSHFNYQVEDGWVDCGTFKMELGEPADGYEKIVFKDIGDNDWIYYVTNRLMKARKDGSERMELDGVCDYHYQIEKIDGDWIYYIKGGSMYKIRTDGSEKEAISRG